MRWYCVFLRRNSAAWRMVRLANQEYNKSMLQQTTSTQIVQYVVNRDDLEQVINNLVEEQMQKFFNSKKAEASKDILLTPKEVAELLDVNLSTLWRWHREGYLTKVYIGDKPRYKQSDIDRILQRGGHQ